MASINQTNRGNAMETHRGEMRHDEEGDADVIIE